MFSRDVLHLWILGGLLLFGAGGYTVARSVLVPDSYGEFGPYRGDALREAQARPSRVTNRAACIACHDERGAAIAKTSHARVHCTDCHGQAKDHVRTCEAAVAAARAQGRDPQKVDCGTDGLKPAALRDACLHCHARVAGRPVKFPQIVLAEHLKEQDAKDPKSPNACAQCHDPHDPAEEPEDAEEAEEAEADDARPAATDPAAPATAAADDE